MEYKEEAINWFRREVIRDYEKYKKNFHIELLNIVGQIVNISQEIEIKLRKELISIIGDNDRDNLDISLERKSSRQLINKLDEKDYFKEKTDLKEKLINVIECRNWVVHTAFKEWEDIKADDNSKVFRDIARSMEVFKANPNPFEKPNGGFVSTGGYKELEDNIENDWKNPHWIDFNSEEYIIGGPTISSVKDWVAVKIVMTKHLMNEFLDVLDKNPLSILSYK